MIKICLLRILEYKCQCFQCFYYYNNSIEAPNNLKNASEVITIVRRIRKTKKVEERLGHKKRRKYKSSQYVLAKE